MLAPWQSYGSPVCKYDVSSCLSLSVEFFQLPVTLITSFMRLVGSFSDDFRRTTWQGPSKRMNIRSNEHVALH
jgi:hypothetical protein